MAGIIASILGSYLDAYRDLVSVEVIDESSATLSLPLHLAAHHRIEITVTDLGNGRCLISDAARTFGELRAAGQTLTKQMMEKLQQVAVLSSVRVVEDTLVMEATYAEVGFAVQKFLELSKTIGDVYLVHRQGVQPEQGLVAEVRAILNAKGLLYRTSEKVRGEIELHPFDLVVPPNGHPGVALSVLGGRNTHNLAQVWGFKCDDIKREAGNQNTKLALIYDVRFDPWSDASKAILQKRADVVLAGDALGSLSASLEAQGVLRN